MNMLKASAASWTSGTMNPGFLGERSVAGDPGVVNELVAADGIVEGIPGLDVQRIRRA